MEMENENGRAGGRQRSDPTTTPGAADEEPHDAGRRGNDVAAATMVASSNRQVPMVAGRSRDGLSEPAVPLVSMMREERKTRARARA
jgi:hypothetical protein